MFGKHQQKITIFEISYKTSNQYAGRSSQSESVTLHVDPSQIIQYGFAFAVTLRMRKLYTDFGSNDKCVEVKILNSWDVCT